MLRFNAVTAIYRRSICVIALYTLSLTTCWATDVAASIANHRAAAHPDSSVDNHMVNHDPKTAVVNPSGMQRKHNSSLRSAPTVKLSPKRGYARPGKSQGTFFSKQKSAQLSNRKPHILQRGWQHIASDYINFYRWHNLAKVGYGVIGSAVFANSRLDEHINAYYQRHFVSSGTDSMARVFKHPGNNSTLLWYLGAGGAGLVLSHWSPNNVIYAWSTRVLRSVLVGAPPVLLLQRVLGSKRPTAGSQWQPFVAEHAVSGHAFLGSLPFITAAQMTSHRSLKILLYGLSTLTGWTRLNDNAHYFSQVVFGWWMGYLAVSSVSRSQMQSTAKHVQWSPYIGPGNSLGVQASLSF